MSTSQKIKELTEARNKMPVYSASWHHYNNLVAAWTREWRLNNTLKGVKR